MDDRALVAAMVAGDPRGLDEAYRRYAARLHAYSRAVLNDAQAAADVVHDTFVVAGLRAGDLRDPDRLLPWLYAIARRACLRQLRLRRREVPATAAFGTGDEATADTIDLGAGLRAAQVREVVHAAAAGLSDGDREIIALALRHDLSVTDIAAVLGVSANHAHARLSRARAALERALGVLLVARSTGCPTLRSTMSGWDGRLDPLRRKRWGRHIDGCAQCLAHRGAVFSPSALLGAYTAGPFAAVADLARGGGTAYVGGGKGDLPLRLDPATGFPARRARTLRATVAVAAAALVVGALLVVVPAGAPRPAPAALEQTTTAAGATTPGGPAGSAPAAASPKPTAPPARTVPPRLIEDPVTPEPPPDPPVVVDPPPTPTRDPPAALAVHATADVECESSGISYVLRVRANTNRPLSSARLRLRNPDSGIESVVIVPSDRFTAAGSRGGLRAPRLEWWVEVTAPGGDSATSIHRNASNPCPPRGTDRRGSS